MPPTLPPTLHIVYLSLDTKRPVPSAVLDPPLQDESIQGARLAAVDNATTGRFLNQNFALDETNAQDEAALLAAFDTALAAGNRIFVADVPAPLLLKLADRPAPHPPCCSTPQRATTICAAPIAVRMCCTCCRIARC